jgi:hypothetical protein
LDHDESYILRIFFVFLAVGLASWAVGYRLIFSWSFMELLLAWVAFFLLIYFGMYALFIVATKHRGLFHSIPAAFFAWALTTYIASGGFHYSPLTSWMLGFFIWIGYITHLILDEIFAVNLTNAAIKRSWGSAFKFYSPNTHILLNIFLYIAIFVLFWWGPPAAPFWNAVFGPKYYATWRGKFWPQGRWFVYRPGASVYRPAPPQQPLKEPSVPDSYRDMR